MKTLLFAAVLGCTVTGLQAGPDADADKYAAAAQARASAAILAPLPQSTTTQDKILAEMQKQTALLKAQQPLIIYDPNVKTVPVTQVPVR